jgi:hypothetical protein
MKHALLLLLVLSSFLCTAQPVINSNVIAPLGATTVYLKSNNPNSFNAGSAGANITWNFATLDTSLTSTQKTVRADTTANYVYFPSVVNRAIEVGSGLATTWGYSYIDNTKYEYYGTKNLGLVQIYVDPERQLQFPFTYNNQFSDTFYDQFPVYYGHTTVKADAYGTLTLPTGTYTNVLRIKTTETYREYDDQNPDDSIFYDGLYYRWYQPNTPNILLEYGKLIKYYIYLGVRYEVDSSKHVSMSRNAGITGIEETESGFYSMAYPNPAGNSLRINAETLIEQAEVIDLCGKMVLQQNFSDKSVVLNLQDLAAGTYYVALTTADKRRKTIRVAHL